jgi:hypothetical protein
VNSDSIAIEGYDSTLRRDWEKIAVLRVLT